MNIKIAFFVNSKNRIESLEDSGFVRVYMKEKGTWKLNKEFSFAMDKVNGLKSIRESIENLVIDLEDCRIFVASKIKGIFYTILDTKGFNTWELEGIPQDFLEMILTKESAEINRKVIQGGENAIYKDNEIIAPVIVDNQGNYFYDLKEIQKKNFSISSKQALLPFLNKVNFKKLEIVCSHIPQWLQNELEKLSYSYNIELINKNEYMVTIFMSRSS